MTTILLTGATGFLGSHLAEALLKKNIKVLAFHRPQSNFWRVQSFKDEIHWFDSEQDLELPFKAYKKINHVIHTATNYGRNQEKNSQLVETNLSFPLKLFELATIFRTDTFLNTDTFFNTDTIVYKYLSSYAVSKKQLCEWLKMCANETKVINIKLQHMYGTKDDDSKFIPHIINKCLAQASQIDLTPGEQKRDFIYIDDVVSAYLFLLEKWNTFNEPYTNIELGTGKTVSIKDLVTSITRLTHSTTQLNFGSIPYRENETMESIANIEALQKLNWTPKTSVESGLKQVIMDMKK